MATTQNEGKKRRTATTPAKRGATAERQDHLQLDPQKLLDFYRKMVEIRLFEDAAQKGWKLATKKAVDAAKEG